MSLTLIGLLTGEAAKTNPASTGAQDQGAGAAFLAAFDAIIAAETPLADQPGPVGTPAPGPVGMAVVMPETTAPATPEASVLALMAQALVGGAFPINDDPIASIPVAPMAPPDRQDEALDLADENLAGASAPVPPIPVAVAVQPAAASAPAPLVQVVTARPDQKVAALRAAAAPVSPEGAVPLGNRPDNVRQTDPAREEPAVVSATLVQPNLPGGNLPVAPVAPVEPRASAPNPVRNGVARKDQVTALPVPPVSAAQALPPAQHAAGPNGVSENQPQSPVAPSQIASTADLPDALVKDTSPTVQAPAPNLPLAAGPAEAPTARAKPLRAEVNVGAQPIPGSPAPDVRPSPDTPNRPVVPVVPVAETAPVLTPNQILRAQMLSQQTAPPVTPGLVPAQVGPNPTVPSDRGSPRRSDVRDERQISAPASSQILQVAETPTRREVAPNVTQVGTLVADISDIPLPDSARTASNGSAFPIIAAPTATTIPAPDQIASEERSATSPPELIATGATETLVSPAPNDMVPLHTRRDDITPVPRSDSLPDIPLQHRQGVLDQVTQVLQKAPGEPVEVILEPAELGRVLVEIIAEGERARVHIQADRPEVAELFRQHRADLVGELKAMGFSSLDLSFGERAPRQEAPPVPVNPDLYPQIDRAETASLPANPTAKSQVGAHRERVDLRL